jgi:hypothetical protein
VVELQPVTAAEALAFLRRAAAPAPDRWDRVAAHLRAHPHGALAAALSTPLMVALARTIYTSPGRDPGELVALASTADQAAVERHLLDEFIPAAYMKRPPAPGTPAPGLRRPPSPDSDLARHWLTRLAADLHQHQSRDLAWWQLPRLVSHHTRRVVIGLAVALPVGLAAGFGSGFTDRLVFGLVVGLMATLLVPEEPAPARVNPRIRGRGRRLARGLGVGLMVGLMLGLALGLGFVLGRVGSPSDVISNYEEGSLTTLLFGSLVGSVWGLVFGFVFGLAAELHGPLDDAVAVTPRSVFRADRAIAITVGLQVGLLFGLVAGFLYGVVDGAVAGAVAGAVVGPGRTSWGQFTIARAWLAARGELPLRLMAFLDDAHHRGVLRQAGAVYQFRHAQLQDHLADTSSVSQTDR